RLPGFVWPADDWDVGLPAFETSARRPPGPLNAAEPVPGCFGRRKSPVSNARPLQRPELPLRNLRVLEEPCPAGCSLRRSVLRGEWLLQNDGRRRATLQFRANPGLENDEPVPDWDPVAWPA